jgi:hypothetical protein
MNIIWKKPGRNNEKNKNTRLGVFDRYGSNLSGLRTAGEAMLLPGG